MACDYVSIRAAGRCTMRVLRRRSALAVEEKTSVLEGSVPSSTGRISVRLKATDLRFSVRGRLCQGSKAMGKCVRLLKFLPPVQPLNYCKDKPTLFPLG